jgi:hypothetical protein
VPAGRSLLNVFPAIAVEWHPTKNRPLTPADLLPKSNRKAWWCCPRDPAHVYAATIAHRTVQHSGCPFCAGKRVLPKDSLAAKAPAIAAEWHPAKNGGLTAADVVPGAKAFAAWRCALHHIWRARVLDRARGRQGCPACPPGRR